MLEVYLPDPTPLIPQYRLPSLLSRAPPPVPPILCAVVITFAEVFVNMVIVDTDYFVLGVGNYFIMLPSLPTHRPQKILTPICIDVCKTEGKSVPIGTPIPLNIT